MLQKVREGLLAVFNRRTQAPSSEEQAFSALLGKFSQIQYLVDQKATLDVIEKAPVGICITNRDYTYEYVNKAYCEIYGYTPDELIGNKFTIVVPEEHQEVLMKLHDEFMDKEHELEGEWEVLTKSKDIRTILASAAYVVDEHGKPKKITFVLDITKRKKAEAELARQRDAREALIVQLRDEVLPVLESGGSAACAAQIRTIVEQVDQ